MTQYITAYHGTRNLKGVLKGGIKPGADVSDVDPFPFPVTFLTDDIGTAALYSDDGTVEVRIPKSWVHIVERAHVVTRRYIPPQMIVRYWKNPGRSACDVNPFDIKFKNVTAGRVTGL